MRVHLTLTGYGKSIQIRELDLVTKVKQKNLHLLEFTYLVLNLRDNSISYIPHVYLCFLGKLIKDKTMRFELVDYTCTSTFFYLHQWIKRVGGYFLMNYHLFINK